MDPNSSANLKKLNDDLQSIHNIMRKTIDDVLDRGNKLDGACLSVSMAVAVSVSVSVSVAVFLSLCFSVCLSLSLCMFLSLSLSVCMLWCCGAVVHDSF